jgi:hypothetical protein
MLTVEEYANLVAAQRDNQIAERLLRPVPRNGSQGPSYVPRLIASPMDNPPFVPGVPLPRDDATISHSSVTMAVGLRASPPVGHEMPPTENEH